MLTLTWWVLPLKCSSQWNRPLRCSDSFYLYVQKSDSLFWWYKCACLFLKINVKATWSRRQRTTMQIHWNWPSFVPPPLEYQPKSMDWVSCLRIFFQATMALRIPFIWNCGIPLTICGSNSLAMNVKDDRVNGCHTESLAKDGNDYYLERDTVSWSNSLRSTYKPFTFTWIIDTRPLVHRQLLRSLLLLLLYLFTLQSHVSFGGTTFKFFQANVLFGCQFATNLLGQGHDDPIGRNIALFFL